MKRGDRVYWIDGLTLLSGSVEGCDGFTVDIDAATVNHEIGEERKQSKTLTGGIIRVEGSKAFIDKPSALELLAIVTIEQVNELTKRREQLTKQSYSIMAELEELSKVRA